MTYPFAYLIKPVTKQELYVAIQTALNFPRAGYPQNSPANSKYLVGCVSLCEDFGV
jgi:two-component SAPR family response regulator